MVTHESPWGSVKRRIAPLARPAGVLKGIGFDAGSGGQFCMHFMG